MENGRPLQPRNVSPPRIKILYQSLGKATLSTGRVPPLRAASVQRRPLLCLAEIGFSGCSPFHVALTDSAFVYFFFVAFIRSRRDLSFEFFENGRLDFRSFVPSSFGIRASCEFVRVFAQAYVSMLTHTAFFFFNKICIKKSFGRIYDRHDETEGLIVCGRYYYCN